MTPLVIKGLKNKPAAILLNANNKGYCRVTLDKDSRNFFLEHLQKCQDDLNRSNIWRIICDNMKMGLVSAQEFIKCFNDHILAENEEYTLPVVLASLQWILHYKVDRPLELQQVKGVLYQTLLKKLSLCKTKTMEVLIL